MPKLDKPYRGSVNLASGIYFPRTSREAFGNSFQVDKRPSRDWAWFVGSLVLVVIAAAVIVWLKKLS